MYIDIIYTYLHVDACMYMYVYMCVCMYVWVNPRVTPFIYSFILYCVSFYL